jgi:pyruvate dehydrogenase (quinone)
MALFYHLKEMIMTENVSEFLIRRLTEWNIKRIFGYPGDGINGLMGALDKAQDKIDFVQTRHEEMAAFMACAHAKFTGEVGVCMTTSGPGAIHLLNGLYDAKLDHQPVVAIVGQQARAAMGGNYQQEVDLTTLFKDVAGNYVHMATVPSQIRHLVDRAVHIALVERTVTCIIVPNDLQEEEAVETPPHAHGTIHSGIGAPAPYMVPVKKDLEAAAKILNEGKKVAVLVGAGTKHASDEVMQVARSFRGWRGQGPAIN